MKRIIVYLNGLRGFFVLEKLIKNNYKDVIVSDKKLKEFEVYKKNPYLKIFYFKKINSKSHYAAGKN